MAIIWKKPGGSSYVELGVDWKLVQTDDKVTIQPIVYRWDSSGTDNYGGRWSEDLKYEPNGTEGYWGNLRFGSGSGTRQLDSFQKRTYTRGKSDYTVSLKIAWTDLGTFYNGSFHNIADGSFTWTITIPAKPSYAVDYDANGGSGSVASQTKWYGEDLVLASSGFTKGYHTLDGWALSSGGAKAYDLGGSYSENAGAALYAHWLVDVPADITAATVTRNSDTSATISWTPGTGYGTTYKSVLIERSVDGGAWAQVASVAGTATSYTDATAANHSYQYRVRAYNDGNGGQHSGYTATSTIVNTPAAPLDVVGERYGAGTSVQLTVSNGAAITADGFEVQYSADQSTWTSVTPSSSTGTPVASMVIDNMTGSAYFRVRNTCSGGSLASAWTVSGLVVVIAPPNAPTLVAPASGAVIGSTSATKQVTFEWQHNPVDGSAQSAYTLQYRKSSAGTWTEVTGTTSSTESVTLDRGYSYVWRVKTKGAATSGGDGNDGYGDWSGTQTFSVLEPPSLTLTLAPLDGDGDIEGMPIDYTIGYLDNHGTFAGGTIAVKLNGAVLYSEQLPATATTVGTLSSIIGQITTGEFLPSSGNTYEFVVSARSSDTLTATLTDSIDVDMGEPYHGTLDIGNDPDTGYVSLTVGWDTSTGSVAAVSASLYRITQEGRVLLGEGLADGAGVVDRYAPLNADYTYEVVTYASSTAIFVKSFPNKLVTDRWFAYWGDGNIAWAVWDPSGSYSLTRPEKKRVRYAGREWPLSYDSKAIEQVHSMGWTAVSIPGKEWSNGFIQMMEDGGRGVYKSCDGWVFHADFDYTETPAYTSLTHMGGISLTITRIDGDVL